MLPVVPEALARRYCAVCHASYSSEFVACPRDGTPLVADRDPLIGTVLADTYRVTSFLGEGALGAVYCAEHTRVERSYAIKFLRGMFVDHPKAQKRFLNEARAAGRLQHPNIAGVVDHGQTDHHMPFLVMELAHGETLGVVMAREGPLPAARALAIVLQIAHGLEHAHTHGVIHRDLKPENIVIEHGRPRIVDFGIALLSELGDAGRYTTKGIVVGTPHYMSPEQLLDETIDARSDLFALGIILYELLAGCSPYTGSAAEAALQIVHGRVPRLSVRAPWVRVKPEVETLLYQLLEPVPAQRPSNASVVVLELERLLAQALEAPTPIGSSAAAAHVSAQLVLARATAPTVSTASIRAFTLRRWFRSISQWFRRLR